MQRPGYLGDFQGLKSKRNTFSQFAGGIFTCFGPKCPPPNKYNLTPIFYPPAPEIAGMAPNSAEAEAKARRLVSQYKGEANEDLSAIQKIGDNDNHAKAKEIYDTAINLEQWTRSAGPPYPYGAIFPIWKRAKKMIANQLATAKMPPPPPTPRKPKTKPSPPEAKSKALKPEKDNDRKKLQQELVSLEQQTQQIEQMPVSPMLAPPSAYTGSPLPSVPKRAVKKTPTTKERIEKLVSKYETQQAMERALPAPTPVSTPKPSPAPAVPKSPPPASKKDGLFQETFSWLKRALFGNGSTLSGFDAVPENNTQTILTIIVVLGLTFLLTRKNEPNL